MDKQKLGGEISSKIQGKIVFSPRFSKTYPYNILPPLNFFFPSTQCCAPLYSSDGWRGNLSPYRICGPIGYVVCVILF